ncbi:MAG TPA: DUF3592 domain-containing protein [Pyrinomonadaceae bacterium]|nr:DUF3592 domain-containing protein [Pyrinomonadaceae bacterium]
MRTLLLGLLFIFLGGSVVLGAAFSLKRTRRFVAESAPVPGEVVGVSERRGRRVMYAPVVRFNGPDDRPLEFIDGVSSSRPAYRVGDRVSVMYCRRDPSDARVSSTYRLYAAEVIFACVGALFAAVGGALVYAFAFG